MLDMDVMYLANQRLVLIEIINQNPIIKISNF